MPIAKDRPIGFSVGALFNEPYTKIVQQNPMVLGGEQLKNIKRMTFYIALPVIDDDGAFRSMIFNIDLDRVRFIAVSDDSITFHSLDEDGSELQTSYNKRHILKLEIQGFKPEEVDTTPLTKEQFLQQQKAAAEAEPAVEERKPPPPSQIRTVPTRHSQEAKR